MRYHALPIHDVTDIATSAMVDAPVHRQFIDLNSMPGLIGSGKNQIQGDAIHDQYIDEHSQSTDEAQNSHTNARVVKHDRRIAYQHSKHVPIVEYA